MDSLKELREYVLTNTTEGANMLELADHYLQSYDKLDGNFVLPKVHEYAKPVVEAFARDPKGFAKWLQKVRDLVPKEDASRNRINFLYRKVVTRALQRERRAREDAAVAKAVKLKLIPDDYQAKLRYTRRLIIEWGRRRLATLAVERKGMNTKHIPIDMQEAILYDFWQAIENEIENGELPSP